MLTGIVAQLKEENEEGYAHCTAVSTADEKRVLPDVYN